MSVATFFKKLFTCGSENSIKKVTEKKNKKFSKKNSNNDNGTINLTKMIFLKLSTLKSTTTTLKCRKKEKCLFLKNLYLIFTTL